jgi:hypothetical protein
MPSGRSRRYTSGAPNLPKSYDVAIRNMFCAHYNDESLRRVTIEICNTFKAVDYNPEIAVFSPDLEALEYVGRDNLEMGFANA